MNFSKELEIFLWRRGFQIREYCPYERVVLPKEISLIKEYLNLLGHYRFRRLLSDIIHSHKDGFIDLERILLRWNLEEISEYWEFLLRSKIIEDMNSRYYFSYPYLDNFGETLEWYLSELLTNDFGIPCLWGIKIKEIKGGGDFDILAILEGNLMYVECKTSPPNNIRLKELWEFLRRREELRSKITILFVDTTLKIERNIIDNIKLLLDKRFSKNTENVILKLKEGIYSCSKGLYIMQSKGDLIRNLQIIFKDFLDG